MAWVGGTQAFANLLTSHQPLSAHDSYRLELMARRNILTEHSFEQRNTFANLQALAIFWGTRRPTGFLQRPSSHDTEADASIESILEDHCLERSNISSPIPKDSRPTGCRWQHGGTQVGRACLPAKEHIEDGFGGIERIFSTHKRSSQA